MFGIKLGQLKYLGGCNVLIHCIQAFNYMCLLSILICVWEEQDCVRTFSISEKNA